MLDDILFLMIFAGMALSVLQIRAKLIDAREHREQNQRESE